MTNKLELPQQPVNQAATTWAVLAISLAMPAVAFAPILIRWGEVEMSPNATIFDRLWIATLVLGLWNGMLALYHKFAPPKPTDSAISEPKILESKIPGSKEPSTTFSTPLTTSLKENLGLLLALGIFFGLSQVCWAWSLTQTAVTNSTIFHNLTPLFTIAGGWLLFQEKFDRRFLIGAAIAMGGAIALGAGDLQVSPDKLGGDLVSLLSAGLYGAYVLVIAKLRSQFTAATLLLWCSATGALFIFPTLLFIDAPILPHSWQGWMTIVSLGVICQVLGQGLIAYSLSRLSPGLVVLFQLLYPILTAIFAATIFLERLSLSNFIEFALVLLGIYLAKSSQYAVK